MSSSGHRFQVAVSVLAWFSVALVAAYVTAALLLSHEFVTVVADGVLAAISAAVVVAFAPGTIRLVGQVVDGRILIRLGIIASWSCTAMLSVYRITVHELHLGIPGDPFRGLISVFFVAAAMLHITAIGAIENHTPRYNVCVVLWAVLVGLLTSAAVDVLVNGLPFI